MPPRDVADRPLKIGRVRVVEKLPPPAPVRSFTIGKVKASSRAPNTSSGARQCTVCEGRVKGGMWFHSRGCAETIVLYRAVEASLYWPCPFHCDPVPLTFGYTHHHTCDFWMTRLDAHPL